MAEEIQPRLIEEEMKESYIDYAMSVIVGRALPDVRDGLKPVHRRILYTMHELSLQHNKPFKKCARIVGDTLGRYHPHGDSSVYDALVRMAQDFSLRYPMIDGQGNFGAIDGDSAAAYRYTEARMAKIAEEMLVDIEKETVDFTPNFDGSMKEPLVLPSRFPNLLVNGSTGIAVGMATNIPPHNLTEVADATLLLLDNPEASILEINEIVKGPDFPTGGIICGTGGIRAAYNTGRGRIYVRGKVDIDEKKNCIIINEIPYMVNKTSLIEQIAHHVNEKLVKGISDIRDESDRDGIRIVIELKKDANPEVVLNQLYKRTTLQTTFGTIMIALHENQPKVMGLKELITHFIEHRKDVIIRRSRYELKKAEERLHILEGLKTALKNIEAVVQLIKKSASANDAKSKLVKSYNLTEIQAQAILDMKLQRLTSLEQDKILREIKELKERIEDLKDILASEQRVIDIIKNEIKELKQKYGDERRTEIIEMEEEIETEDMIPEENVIVTATYSGYIKKIPIEAYKMQKRGGYGIKGAKTKEEDVIEHLFTSSTHSTILCFSNKGKVYWLKGYEIPTASRYSKGKAIINLLKLEKDERINTMIPLKHFDEKHFLIMVTKKGLIKKTSLEAFSNPRKTGIIAIKLMPKDELVQVRLTPGNLKFIVGSRNGFAVKFSEENVRAMGRNAAGVRAIRLGKGDKVVGLEVALEIGSLLTITENGYGKRSSVSDYRLINRGGKGVINIKTSARNGRVVGIKTVMEHDEIIVITQKGIVIRMSAAGVSEIGRNTQGMRIMKLRENDKVKTVARVIKHKES